MAKDPKKLVEKGKVYLDKGEWTKAQKVLGEAIDLLEGTIDTDEERGDFARVLIRMAKAETRLGNFEVARNNFKQAIEICKQTDETICETEVLRGLAYILMQENKMGEALDMFEQAHTKAREAGDMGLMGTITIDIGLLYHRLRKFSMAKEEYSRAIIQLSSTERKNQLARAYNNLGDAHMWLDELEEAIDRCQQAMDLAGTTGDLSLMAVAAMGVGECFARMDEIPTAKKYLDKATKTLEETGDRLLLAQAYRVHGITCTFEGDFDKAQEWFERSLKVSREHGTSIDEGKTLYEMANMYMAKIKVDKAREALDKAIQCFELIGHETWTLKAKELKDKL